MIYIKLNRSSYFALSRILSHIPLPEGVGQRHDQRAAQDEAERMAVDQQELLPEGMVEDVELGHLALVLVETGMKQQPELGELHIKSIEKNHQ